MEAGRDLYGRINLGRRDLNDLLGAEDVVAVEFRGYGFYLPKSLSAGLFQGRFEINQAILQMKMN